MKTILILIIFTFPLSSICQSSSSDEYVGRVVSTVDSTHASNVVLKQQFEVNVPLDSVWEAYTTEEGWESWAVAVAQMDFKIGGLIQTLYDKTATIGSPGTITLHVVNYIPNRMITLQAELTEHFPAFMKEDAQNLFNIIYFEPLSESKTRITSYGLGYRKTPKYRALLEFFIIGNESSYHQLIAYLETGEIIKF